MCRTINRAIFAHFVFHLVSPPAVYPLQNLLSKDALWMQLHGFLYQPQLPNLDFIIAL